jgi:hypothetical protein
MACSAASKDGRESASDLDAGGDSGSQSTGSSYAGGWPEDACRDDISPTGDRAGDIANNWTRMDQFGEQIALHDFCDHTVLVVGSAFW